MILQPISNFTTPFMSHKNSSVIKPKFVTESILTNGETLEETCINRCLRSGYFTYIIVVVVLNDPLFHLLNTPR